ncbi:response regulator transcription factor [Pleionea mediterranea]|uniref:LuxR family two component transcriptional regulator n=1 Tax=Pleionea mediterranea TaxID=523701 RepID=A0A316FXZ4_9GAMM|nr:response regulator transcription factor [Pleionea mediterranea]PWK53634.1 LuxR family two component transcriptional regulator [Pleionea mediterranea]
MNSSISILIAEDQTLLLGALKSLLELEPDFNIVATANNGKDALSELQHHQPDILLTDIEMPEKTGLDLAEYIKQQDLSTKVIIMTTFARSGYLRRAMDSGVKGYLLKDSSSEELAKAIRRIHQGKKVIDPELITEAWDQVDPLTDKERQALKLASDGFSTESIAKKMHLSPGTVRNYLSNAASKLNAKNSIEAARIARQKGWL